MPFRLSVASEQIILMVVILTLAYAMSRIGLGAVARYAFIVVGMACAWHYIRRSPWDYLTITLWFWTLTPLARRLIDYNAGFYATTPLLATPNFMTVFMLGDLLTSRRLLRQHEAVGGLLILLSAVYGMIVSMVQGDVFPAMVAAADWIMPLLYFFYFLCHANRVDEAEKAFRNFISINALVMFVYGLWQFVSPLPWDVAWMIAADMKTIGQPLPYELRIFGTLNSPGIDALWLSSLLLMMLHFRTKLSALLAPIGVLVLLLTSVRIAAGSVVVGLLIAGATGRRDVLKFVGVGIIATAIIFFGVAAVDPTMTDIVFKRLSTVNDLGNDDSALERAYLYRRSPTWINDAPLGVGIAAIGRGATAANHPERANLDSGPIAIYLTMGWVAGSIYTLGLFLITAQALLVAIRNRSSAALAMAVTAIGAVATLPFANVAGLLGVTLYVSTGYALAVGTSAHNKLRLAKVFRLRQRLPAKAIANS